jgi:hypothetical protein
MFRAASQLKEPQHERSEFADSDTSACMDFDGMSLPGRKQFDSSRANSRVNAAEPR